MSAAVAALLPVCAQAQGINPFQGFYIGAGGGAEWAIGSTNDVRPGPAGQSAARPATISSGPALEVEVGYGQIPTSANIPGTAINGKVGPLNAMANVLYDFMPASRDHAVYRRRRGRSLRR